MRRMLCFKLLLRINVCQLYYTSFRFTDFLVYEIDLDSNVFHIKSLDKPTSPTKDPVPQVVSPSKSAGEDDAMQGIQDSNVKVSTEEVPVEDKALLDLPETNTPTAVASDTSAKGKHKKEDATEPWPELFNTTLTAFLSDDAVSQVKQMYLEGPEPPRVSDGGWGSRPSRPEGAAEEMSEPVQKEPESSETGKRGGRGGRGGRGRGRGRGGGGREDRRKVLSNVCSNPICL